MTTRTTHHTADLNGDALTLRPIHLARQLQTAIRQGRWPARSRLPATRQLARQFNASLGTVQGALRELEYLGLVYRKPRVGIFVAPRKGVPTDRQGGPRIAVLLVRPEDPSPPVREGTWAQRILQSAQETLSQTEGQLMLIAGDSHRIAQWEADLDSKTQPPAGVLSFVDPASRPVLKKLSQRGVPWVTINPLTDGTLHNFVSADNFEGGRLIGRCFARLNLHQCLLLSDSIARSESRTPKVSTQRKIHGFLQGCMDEGMPLAGVQYVWNDEQNSEQTAYQNTLRHLDRFGPPQGLFAEGDFAALGAMRALREQGIAVPRQTSVVGGTGLMVGEYAHPALTALQQPMEEMGQAAAQMLLQLIEERTDRILGRHIPCKFLSRQSLRLTEEIRRLIADTLKTD